MSAQPRVYCAGCHDEKLPTTYAAAAERGTGTDERHASSVFHPEEESVNDVVRDVPLVGVGGPCTYNADARMGDAVKAAKSPAGAASAYVTPAPFVQIRSPESVIPACRPRLCVFRRRAVAEAPVTKSTSRLARADVIVARAE